MKRILCISLPNWPIQRLLVARPELKQYAVVLHARDSRRGQRVVACSRLARECGVKVDMPLAEVEGMPALGAASDPVTITRLTNRDARQASPNTSAIQPNAHITEHDADADRAAIEKLARWSELFSPYIGIEITNLSSCLLLDITGSAPRLGGEQQLSRCALHGLKRQGYFAKAATAETLAVAWAVAHFGSPDQSLTQPSWMDDGVIVPPGEHVTALQSLPVESLRLDEQTVALLHQLGVMQVGHLLQLPRSSLSARFGAELLCRLDQATGQLAEPILAHHAPRPLHVECWLENPTDRRDLIEQVIRQLLADLVAGLNEQDLGAVQLQLQIHTTDKTYVKLNVGLFRPTADAQHLLPLLQMQLERHQFAAPVTGVTLITPLTARLEERQKQLLDGSAVHSQHLRLLIDRLSNRLGRKTVLAAKLLADAQPERAFQWMPLAGTTLRRATRASQAARQRHEHAPGIRPLQIEPQPIPVQTIAVIPDGPPISFRHQGNTHRIAQHWGPERIETGWWRGDAIHRDYYRVQDEAGCRFWIFRERKTGKWFLQGEF